MSMTSCIKQLKGSLDSEDIARVKELARELRDDGMTSSEAAMSASRRAMTELFTYRKGVVAEIEKQGGVAPKRSQDEVVEEEHLEGLGFPGEEAEPELDAVAPAPAKPIKPVQVTPRQLTPLPNRVSVGPSSFEPKPITGDLYRETSKEGLSDLITGVLSNTPEQGSITSIHVADNLDMALGQGENRGIMVELDGNLVSGRAVQKPGIIEGITGKGYKAEFVGRDAIKRFVLPKGVRFSGAARVMANHHFNVVKNDDGSITYERKDLSIASLTPKKKPLPKGIVDSDKNTTLFSVDGSPSPLTKQFTKQQVLEAIQPQIDKIKKLGVNVNVVGTHNFGPNLQSLSKHGRIRGFVSGNNINLVYDNFTSLDEARITMHHESVGHIGVNGVVGDNWDKLVDSFADLRASTDPEVQSVMGELDERYKDAEPVTQIEEFIAITSERRFTEGPIKTFLRKVMTYVKLGLRKLGIRKDFSMADIDNLLFKGRRNLETMGTDEGIFSPDTSLDIDVDEDVADVPFAAHVETLGESVIRTWQDKFRPVLGTQSEIEKATGVEIPERLDVYRAEEAFYGKTEEDLRKLEEDYIKPIAEGLNQHKITPEELGQWLTAKHAQERNEHIASINPEMQDGGSGMTTAEANRILTEAETSGKADALNEVSAHVYALLQQQRDLMSEHLQFGEVATAWEDKYEFYVPLKGLAADEKLSRGKATGTGYDIRGKETKRALGRASEAESPLLHAISDAGETIIRARKNEVGNVLLELVEANPNKAYWEIFTDESPDVKRMLVKNAEGETVVSGKANMAAMRRDYFATKRDGKTYYIKLHDERLMRAMQNMGPEPMGAVMSGLNKMTRFLSSMSTSYNPEFIVSNMARDVQTAVINLFAEQDLPQGRATGKHIAGKMVKDIPISIRAIHASLYNETLTGAAGEWQSVFQQFREDGAKTGWFDLPDVDEQAKRLSNLVTQSQTGAKGTSARALKAIKDLVEHANSAVENGVRLSVYKHAIDSGVTRAKAASLAKNLTINFNRKGEIGAALNSLYMFANASIQGVAVFARAMGTLKKTPDGKVSLNAAQKLAGGLVAASFTLAMMNRGSAGEDEDGVNWYDKVPSHVRERNLVLMKSLFGGPEGEYYTIPLPYGYNIFHVLGDSAESSLNSDFRSNQEIGVHITMAALGSFSPIGVETSKEFPKALAKTATPTVLSPFVQLAVNENFYGSPIYRENFPFGTQKPDSAMVKKNTKEHWIAITDFLNSATGGSSYQSGYLDISPDTLNHLFDFTFGGAGQFVGRTANVIEKVTAGEKVEKRDIPFVRKTGGEVTSYPDTNRFYDRGNKIKQIHDEYKSLKGREKLLFRQKNLADIKMRKMVAATEKRLKALRKTRKKVEASTRMAETDRRARLEKVKVQMKASVDRFNKLYNELH